MKTSNKLLLTFLIAVFLLPVCTFFVLKGIVKEGKYSVKYYSSDGYYSGSIEGYKAIKIIGANDHIADGGGLMCVIHHSDSAHYAYYNYNYNDNNNVNDSISVGVIGNTLVVQRLIIGPKDTSYHYSTSIQRNVDLYLPSFQNISVSNAVVNLNSNQTENISINLKDNSNLIFSANAQSPMNAADSISNKTIFKNMSINASKSSILFNSDISFDSLYLNVDSTSKINFLTNTFSVKSLKGSIDKKAAVSANLEMSKRIMPLVK